MITYEGAKTFARTVWEIILRPSLAFIYTAISNFFLRSHILILLVLTSVIVGPIFWFSFEFFNLLSMTSEQKAAVADSDLFLSLLFFFSNSANFGQVWTVLTPVIFAVSAGSSLDAGLRPISVFLFTIFFGGFVCSEFCANFFLIDPEFKTMISAAATKARIDLNFEEFAKYSNDVGIMCISSVAITLGISLAKN